MEPTRGSDRQSSGRKAGAIDILSGGSVGTREVAFTFCSGDFVRGCIDTRLLVLPCVGLDQSPNRQGGCNRRLEDPVRVPM